MFLKGFIMLRVSGYSLIGGVSVWSLGLIQAGYIVNPRKLEHGLGMSSARIPQP